MRFYHASTAENDIANAKPLTADGNPKFPLFKIELKSEGMEMHVSVLGPILNMQKRRLLERLDKIVDQRKNFTGIDLLNVAYELRRPGAEPENPWPQDIRRLHPGTYWIIESSDRVLRQALAGPKWDSPRPVSKSVSEEPKHKHLIVKISSTIEEWHWCQRCSGSEICISAAFLVSFDAGRRW